MVIWGWRILEADCFPSCAGRLTRDQRGRGDGTQEALR
jgi:hypothetical protein